MRERAHQGKPDLVGLAEISDRLGVAPATVSRWHRRSMLPDPDLRIGTLELWMWETVRQWGKQRSRFGRRTRQQVATPDIVVTADIAGRLAVGARTVEIWMRTNAFPPPDYRWDTTEAWLWETVERWSQTSLPHLPQVSPRLAASGPSLQPTGSPPPVAVAAPPASTEVTVAPATGRDPVGDIDRIHRYFSELARSLQGSG
ncbi:MAG: hypothetical protein KJO97_14145 [Acidimicrobiia bacterium]|nr:hypothetical protein [Acidimicrobiia bacterium]